MNVTRTARWIPHGDAGTMATLHHMARLIRDASTEWIVRDTAQRIVSSVHPDDGPGRCEAIRAWCAGHVRFVADPASETIHTPALQLAVIGRDGVIGVDCDDVAVLAGGLGAAVGCGVRLTAVSFLDFSDSFSHVWASLLPPLGTGPDWIECDVTRPFQDVPLDALSRVVIIPVTD
jgi:hypothetical protein